MYIQIRLVLLLFVLAFCGCRATEYNYIANYPSCLCLEANVDAAGTEVIYSSCVPFKKVGLEYYCLTCAHSVSPTEDALYSGFSIQVPNISTGLLSENSVEEIECSVVGVDHSCDLAVIKFTYLGDIRLSYVSDRKLYTLEKVYNMGYPGGTFLTISKGDVQFINSEGYLVVRCDAAPGISGGGIYIDNSFDLVAISAAVYNNENDHISYLDVAVPADKILSFIKSLGL